MEKSAENCKISQKSGISKQILDKIRVQQCENLQYLKDILISLYTVFILSKILFGF